jgi:hypothetical protein
MEKNMNKKVITVYTTIILSISLLFPLTSIQAEEISVACGLYSKSEAEGLLKQTVTDGVSHTTIMPAGNSCRYTYTKNGNIYSLKLRVSHSDEIKNEGIQDSVADVIERQKRTRKNNPHAAKLFQEIQNLGTDAFWSGEDLWVRKDDTLLIISVHSFLEGSFKTMEESKKAGEEQNKGLSLQVAKTVLAKLN